MMHSNADREWQKLGEDDPYFGVLSLPQYRRETITKSHLEEFFHSGEEYVKQMLDMARVRVDAPLRFRRALDFGCGVGRLSMPLAEHADSVLGVDVSPAMLCEARANSKHRNLHNIEFLDSETWLAESDQKFDFIHTYIVLQHVPIKHGISIIRMLLDRLDNNGIGVIHLTYEKNSNKIKSNYWIRKWIPLAHNLINVVRGRSFFAPMMQMNSYDLNSVLRLIQERGITDLHAQYTNHGGHLGVSLHFKSPNTISTITHAA